MKTYKYVVCFVLALSFFACEKSSEQVEEEEVASIVQVDYTVFLQNNSQLNGVVVESDNEGFAVKSTLGSFNDIPSNAITYRTETGISYYATTNCQATLQWYKEENSTSESVTLFEDTSACDINVLAMAHSNEIVAVAYERELLGKDKQSVVRINSLMSTVNSPTEISLDKKPVDMVISTNRLFVLTLNEFITDEFHLSAIDLNTNEVLMELDLGLDAQRLFTNTNGDVIVSYPELHTILDPITLDKSYTTYGKNTEPGFITTTDYYMDNSGKFYFQKNVPTAKIEEVPAIYDFEKNNTVVYLFENFLTETELNMKYNIANTSAIAYDEKNNFVLIGYEKNGQADKGGILRITPAPEFKLIDNIDLDGVPKTIFVK
ncbi:hypothetical protein [Maribacter ulvicola]|uniref:TolB-like 6-blade propeller-like n=1 Tax=Maribacter ulvicola TaxID=228959 RepID=A0A1N6U497_9FLAO|nr:hypothetical protein [Maribacter ulvicola]SIQ60465.1 hypothetical protein SAMN05421797_102196 [Maribacter ulvicola]